MKYNILGAFIDEMIEAGHRQETIAFISSVSGFEMDAGSFYVQYKDAVKVRCSPSKSRNLFNYLVRCGMIRTNNR